MIFVYKFINKEIVYKINLTENNFFKSQKLKYLYLISLQESINLPEIILTYIFLLN